MKMQRRQVIGAAIGGAFAATLAPQGAVRAAEAPAAAKFVKPTAQAPLLACFNENPLGLSQEARAAVAKSAAVCNRYPFARAEVLRKACADFVGGKPEQIVLSQGSAEAIRAAVESYAHEPGAALIIPELTYSDGEMAAKRNGMPVVKVKMGKNWSIDIPAMRAAAAEAAKKGTAVVYFVNPNNPTSTVADTKLLFDWIRSQPKNTVFLMDEAYGEFVVDPEWKSTIELVNAGAKNVIVLKTFSKIFAMAGLRLGFAFAAPELVKRVHDHIAYDFFQNTPAIEAALAEIGDLGFLRLSNAENKEARRIMEELFNELKLEHLPSQTNFCFFNLKGPLEPFAKAMKAEHILVGRPFPPALTWCRISYVRPAEMQYVADVMRGLRKKGLL